MQPVSIALKDFQSGFLYRGLLNDLVDARKQAEAQAIGEGVRQILKRAGPRGLQKARALSMSVAERQARQLPRRLPLYAPNPPPNPPMIRGKVQSASLRNLRRVLYMVDQPASPSSVTVGPVKLKDRPVPMLLEQGGSKMSSSRRRVRKIGGGGEIDLDRGVPSRNGKVRFSRGSKTWEPAFPDDGSMVRVRYIKLTTTAQVERSQRINHMLYRPPRPVTLRPRAYMRKATNEVLSGAARPEREARAKRLYDTASKAIARGGKASMQRITG